MAFFKKFNLNQFLKTSTGCLVTSLCLSVSWAADPSTAALRVLLGTSESSQMGASAPDSNASQSIQRRTISVLRGETLDRAIRRAAPGLPLHPDFLRQAFVAVNPQVFPKGAPHNLRAGTTLQVPTATELRFMLVSQYPESVNLFQIPDATSTADQGPQQAKRHWVRFP